MAALRPSGQAGNRVFPATVMTMTSQWHGCHNIDMRAEIKPLQITHSQILASDGLFN
jgi:hypothetical protein